MTTFIGLHDSCPICHQTGKNLKAHGSSGIGDSKTGRVISAEYIYQCKTCNIKFSSTKELPDEITILFHPDSKVFMWVFDGMPYYGPHYSWDVDAIGASLVHDLEDLLKTNISESIKRRLANAKIGTEFNVLKLCTRGYLKLKRINLDELAIAVELIKINSQYTALRSQLSKVDEVRIDLSKKLMGEEINNRYAEY